MLFARALGDERGLALPMALGVTMVLSALAAGIFAYTTMNQGTARRAQADQRAYGLAETGLSYALSRLQNAADPYDATHVPSTTVTLTGGTTTYSGSLSGTTWTLTASGTVTNPSGPHAANIVRTVSIQAQITTIDAGGHASVGLPLHRPAVRLHHDGEQRDAWTSRCTCAATSASTNNSQVDSPAVHLLGSLYVENSAQIGAVASPIEEFAATGTCHYSGA